jgi:tRNA(Ile)-lysidine synthase
MPVQSSPLAGFVWPKFKASVVVGANQLLSCVPAVGGIAEEDWRNATVVVKFRCGGEKIALPNREGHHALKNLFQEAGIPPWQRAAMPLVYLDDKLAAVGDKWVSRDFYREEAGALRLVMSTVQPH